MSHHIYTTPGFITHSRPHGESGKFFLIFTRELGMIGVTAQGVRLSQSKLRYYTQDFSYGLFSVVRGKEVWRMTGSKEMVGGGEVTDIENKKVFVRVLQLLNRLLPGEEKNERLFEVIEKFYIFLSENRQKEILELVEYLTVLRILYFLGYVSNEVSFSFLLSEPTITDNTLDETKKLKSQIIKEINSGLKESQL